MAVRNAEGGFYLCQAMNNVYKSSPKIRIRWLSQDSMKKNLYGSDFDDHTDIECELTSILLNKMALDVEKGIVGKPHVTGKNLDGCKKNRT